MKKERKEMQIGEWQVDSTGRRYRKVGDCIEYAMEITTTHGTMYADELNRFNKQLNEQQVPKQEPRTIDKTCPIKTFKVTSYANCDVKCAFFNGTGCRFGVADPEHITETKGKYCPFMFKCNERCALYQSGCTMKLVR